MSPNEIIAMARDANPEHDLTAMLPFLRRFAAMVAAKEREACAQVCEGFKQGNSATYIDDGLGRHVRRRHTRLDRF